MALAILRMVQALFRGPWPVRLSPAGLLLAALWPWPVLAGEMVELQALASIVAVPDAQHVLVNRGPAHGLKPTQPLEIHPLRLDAKKQGSYDDKNVLAWGAVEPGAGPRQLRLRVIGATLPLVAGDVVGWRLQLPAEVAEEPLAQLLALGLQLLDAETRAPLAELEALQAQPSAAEIRRQISAIVQASRRGAALAREFFPAARAKGGRHGGKTLAEALEQTTDADVEEFLRYALAFRESYAGRTALWLDFYATWLTNGALDGRDELRRQHHQRLVDRALEAGRRGDLEQVRVLAGQMLALDADSAHAGPLQRKLARRSNLMSRLQDDPDDAELRGELAGLLADLGDLDGAQAQWAQLLARDPQQRRAASRRAQVLELQGKWAEAAAIWRQLSKAKGAQGPNAAEQTALSVQRAMDLPGDPTAALQAGLLLQRRQADRPVALILHLLRRVRQTSLQAEQLRQAWNAEQDEVRRMGKASTLQAAADAIADHRYGRVRELLARLGELHSGQPAEMAGAYAVLLDAAMRMGTQDFAEELLQGWTALDPQSSEAWYFFAILKMFQRRPEEALRWADKGFAVAPREPINFWLRLRLLCTLGRTDEARAAAERLLQLEGRSTSALVSSARAALAQGRHADALQRMAKAWARAFAAPEGQVAVADRAAVEVASEQEAILQRRPHDRAARLRLVRALLELDLVPQAEAQWLKLPAGCPEWRDAAAALGGNTAAPLNKVVEWQRAAQDGSLARRRALELVEAEAAVAQNPADPAARLRFAKALLSDGQFHAALDAVAVGRDQPTALPSLLAELAEVEVLGRQGLGGRQAHQRARAALDDDDAAQAERAASQALQEFLRLGALTDAVAAAQTLASARSTQGNDQGALAAADHMMQIARQLGDPYTVAIQGEVLAQIQVRAGQLAAWAPALGQVQAQCERRGSLSCLADTRLHRARMHQREGQVLQALSEATLARALAERAGNLKTHRRAMQAQAYAQRDAAMLAEAASTTDELLRAARDAGDAPIENDALLLSVHLAWQRDQPLQVEQRLAQAEAKAKQGGNRYMQAALRQERAAWWSQGRGEPQQALPYLQGLPEEFRRLGYRQQQAEAEVLLAKTQWAAELPELASASAVRAEKLAREQGLPAVEAEALRLIALTLRSADRCDQAVAAARRSVALAEQQASAELVPLARHALAVALGRAGKPEDSLAEMERAVQALVQLAVATTGYGPGAAARRDQDRVWADAIQLQIDRGRADRAQVLSALARAAQARQTRRLGATEAGQAPGEDLLQAYAAAQRQSQAAGRIAQETRGAAQESRAWQSRAAESSQQAAALLAQMRRDHRRLWTQVAVEPESLREQLPHLPKKSVIVQYFATPTHLYAFVLGGDRPETRVVKVEVAWSRVEAAIARWRKVVLGGADRVALRGAQTFGVGDGEHSDSPADLAETATVAAGERAPSELLYGWLIEPLRDELRGAPLVLVVPFGALHYLPLHALARWDDQGQPHYAIEDLQIGYLSGTTATALSDRPRGPDGRLKVLGFGNPDGSLPGARAELERAKPFLPAGSQLWFEREATSKRFLSIAPQFDVLHIATHGVLRPDPADSHLIMADGPLTLAAISGAAGLDRRPRLVVLSACSTALEQGKAPGDEIASLSNAFAIAGVPSLVATLWDVDDQATAELVTAFYRHLAQPGPRDTLGALRKAQLHLLAQGRDGRREWLSPAAWAGLQLVGDPR